MSRILHLVNMGLRYGRSKGVRFTRLEETPLASLAAPCHLEESASHHDHQFFMVFHDFQKTSRYYNRPRNIQEP